jgi:hypothetical protein
MQPSAPIDAGIQTGALTMPKPDYTLQARPISRFPQHEDFLDCDLAITFGSASFSLFRKDDILREIDRHKGLGVLRAAIFALDDKMLIDMEN